MTEPTSAAPPPDDQRLVALVPQTLAAHHTTPDILEVLAHPLFDRAARISSDWQARSLYAEMWELGATTHGVQRDRMAEVVGLCAGIGEQLALARAAVIECERWRLSRAERETPGDEMCHRALAELLAYYCIAVGHGLANLTGRLLALNSAHHPALIDQMGTTLPPHSNDRRDWLSCDFDTLRRLRKATRSTTDQASMQVAQPLTDLVGSEAWIQLTERRATDFHRRRPQSAGIEGVPLRSLWTFTDGGGWRLSIGGPRNYDDGRQLATLSTQIGRSALGSIVTAMDELNFVIERIVRRTVGDD